ncbi:hypothetical protein GY45DRAFT_982191 [Cubamyces sp. BRFM 1775]|nr:hypothetical protein GY45DRAFT_982191 [Cubamyces sp. BRFM 1775]
MTACAQAHYRCVASPLRHLHIYSLLASISRALSAQKASLNDKGRARASISGTIRHTTSTIITHPCPGLRGIQGRLRSFTSDPPHSPPAIVTAATAEPPRIVRAAQQLQPLVDILVAQVRLRTRDTVRLLLSREGEANIAMNLYTLWCTFVFHLFTMGVSTPPCRRLFDSKVLGRLITPRYSLVHTLV